MIRSFSFRLAMPLCLLVSLVVLGCKEDGPAARKFCDQAVAKLATGDLNGARELADSAISAKSSYPGAYALRGSISMRSGNAEDALDDYDEAVSLDEKWALARLLRAGAYDRLNKMNRSRADEEYAGTLDAQMMGIPPAGAHNMVGTRFKVCAHGAP